MSVGTECFTSAIKFSHLWLKKYIKFLFVALLLFTHFYYTFFLLRANHKLRHQNRGYGRVSQKLTQNDRRGRGKQKKVLYSAQIIDTESQTSNLRDRKLTSG